LAVACLSARVSHTA